MLGSTEISAVLGAAPPASSETDVLKRFVRAAAGAGLALLFIAPGAKTPVDMRSGAQRTKDDKGARDAAKAQGDPRWDKVKSKAGAHLATTDTTKLARYLDQYRLTWPHDPVNLGVEVGRSRVVVVDCDTAEQVSAFLDFMGVPPEERIPPTVTTPGARNEAGDWVHSQGGHFWFTLPDGVILPEGVGSLVHPEGKWALLWKDRYVLIPPSVRAEGVYQLTGLDYPLPDALFQLIQDHAGSRKAQAATHAAGSTAAATAIDAWAENVGWDTILAASGWSLTARPDQCGCQVWTAPGSHHSPKSATAHDGGCSLGRYTQVNAPLHVWTDNPGPELEAWIVAHGTKTITKLQVVAALDHHGDVGKAMEAVGVVPDLSVDRALGLDPKSAGMEGLNPQSAGDPFSVPGEVPPTPEGEGESEEEVGEDPPEWGDVLTPEEGSRHPTIAPFDYWRDLPAPEYAVEGLLEHRGLTSIIGAANVGKSCLAIDMACCLATGTRWQGRKVLPQKVVYLPGEGLTGTVQRIKAWEAAHHTSVHPNLLLGNSIMQVAGDTEDWVRMGRFLLHHRVGLIIFDTFARMSGGLEENSATDVGRAIIRMDQLRHLTRAGVMLIHHTAKGASHGRGSSALNAALDTELLVEPGEWDSSQAQGVAIQLRTTKQKNAALLDNPLPLLLSPLAGSVVVTGPTGTVEDPLTGVDMPLVATPEPLVELAIRLQDYAHRFPEQGVTRADLVSGVVPDEYTRARKNAEPRWKRLVHEGVDLGLRYGLLETVTGRRTGTRYVQGPVGPDAARDRAVQEALAS